MEIGEIKQTIERCKGIASYLEKDIEKNNVKKQHLENRLVLLEKAQSLLQQVAQKTQEKLKFQLEDIVNLALETCFPNEYLFQINFNISRGKTDAELVFLDKKTNRTVDPMLASGGGVVDLTCFALRVACYTLEKNVDNVIILDEPFRFLSKDLQSQAGEILRVLSKKMNLQIIMVSHIAEMVDIADKVFEVKKKDSVSNVKVILE